MFIGDPSYFPKSKCRATGKVVRSICILDHLPPNLGDAMSAQIIIPGPQVRASYGPHALPNVSLSRQVGACV